MSCTQKLDHNQKEKPFFVIDKISVFGRSIERKYMTGQANKSVWKNFDSTQTYK